MLRHGVILEGPDGTGKSSLGRHLQRTFGLEYHYGGGPPDTMEGVVRCMETNLARIAYPSIQDRVTIISEPIYRSVLDPKVHARYSIPFHNWQRVMLEQYDPIIVYCCAENGGERATRESYETDEFTRLLHARLPLIVEKYDSLMKELEWMRARLIRYDFRRTTLEEISERIAMIDAVNADRLR